MQRRLDVAHHGAEDANHRAPPGSGAHPATGILRTIDEMAEQHANIARK